MYHGYMSIIRRINDSIQDYEQAHAWADFPVQGFPGLKMASKIDDNLWMGSVPTYAGPPAEFKSVLDMYTWETYKVAEGTERRTFRMPDGKYLPEPEVLFELADWVNERRKIGPVLVHCQAGINRSGLISALALIRSGLDPLNAIKQVRERRAPYALSNGFFTDFLRELGGYDDGRISASNTAFC